MGDLQTTFSRRLPPLVIGISSLVIDEEMPRRLLSGRGGHQMERVKRVRMLIMQAQNAVHQGGDQQAVLKPLQEAIELVRKIEVDMNRFRDRLAPTGRTGAPSERW